MVKLFEKEKTIDMVSINTVGDVKSVLAIDPELDDKKNPKIFYNLFDENFQMNSYHL